MSARGTAVSLALIIGGAPGALGAGDLDLPLRLAWLDVSGVTHGVGGVARAEAREILNESGLDVAWRLGSEGEESRPGEIRVILDARLRMNRRSRRPVLGETPVGFHEHPFLWIHVPSIRATLGLAPRASVHPLELRERRNLGVALGRVIAHEIVHALAPSLPHGGGLMSEKLTRLQLTAARLSIDPDVIRAVRERLHDWPTAPPFEPSLLAAEGAAEIR